MAEQTTNKPWDGSASRFTDEQWRRSCLIKGPAPYKQTCKLPVREPDGTLNCRAVAAAKARLNQVKGSTQGAAEKLQRLTAICQRTSADSRRQMDFLAKIRETLGLDEKATEDEVLEAVKANPLAKVAKALGLDESADADAVVSALEAKLEAGAAQTLEERAEKENKVVVTKADFDGLKALAEAGNRAAEELREQKFDHAITKAREEGRLDAKDETRERLHKLYEAEPEATLEHIAELPKIVNTEPRGSGAGAQPGEPPAGIDPDSFELDRRVRLHMAEHDEEDYEKALDAVLKADRRKVAA